MPRRRAASIAGDGDDQRDRVERVRGVGAAVGLEHVIGVAVVGGDHARAAGLVHGGDDLAEALRRRSRRRATAAGMTPVWPTMSALAKLMIPNRGRSSRQARTNAAAASAALISGLWS